MRRILPIVLAAWVYGPGAAAATTPGEGNWINPRGTVMVTTGPCHDRLCGWVRWADKSALADAADAGVAHLVGTELLRDYRATAVGRWSGRVYVPDMGRSFSSTIKQLDADRLKISGCLLGNWVCRNQIWSRQPTG